MKTRLNRMRSGIPCLLLALTCTGADSSTWPQWRGPDQTGVSPATGLPTEWSADAGVIWKAELPAWSGGTPIVGDDRVFVTTPSRAPAVSLDEGNHTWRKHNNTSPSPVTDGRHVWVVTGTGVVTAFTVQGERVWKRDLQAEFGQFGLMWGYASSPTLHDGKLIIEVLHGMHTDDPSYVVAFEGVTGEVLWRAERPTDAQRESPDAYTTPVVLSTPGGSRS